MEDKMIMTKNTMLYYLMNELGNVNLEVTTVLTENGSWSGHIIIKQTDLEATDDVVYLRDLQKQ